jgi:methyl halide transferase
VAIPPKLRPDWAKQMNKLVKLGGYLVTLIYPIAPAPYEGGPPHYVQPEHYDEVLGEEWQKIIDEEPKVKMEKRMSGERMVVRRKL